MLPVVCNQAWPRIPQPSYFRSFGLNEADSRFAVASMFGESFLPVSHQRLDFTETRPNLGSFRAFPAAQSGWGEALSLDDVASLVWPNVLFNVKPLCGEATAVAPFTSSSSDRSQEKIHGVIKESKKNSLSTFGIQHHSICFSNHGCSLQVQEPPKRRPMKKIVLTSEKACEIYSFKADADGSSGSNESIAVRSQHIAARYEVDAKTVRDIWNRKTWVHKTKALWTPQVQPPEREEEVGAARDRGRIALRTERNGVGDAGRPAVCSCVSSSHLVFTIGEAGAARDLRPHDRGPAGGGGVPPHNLPGPLDPQGAALCGVTEGEGGGCVPVQSRAAFLGGGGT
eukprot:CAMPEP_0172166124 /NCGR_PEP_ID=MMETSP1050-20130122/8803_1 /TAXON_ID=233186 /ORGANISM="Cryptomonas curvata, Strain CCAP979/52" /LENGTH=340 /DNA_ID=CAMNT_0012836691 /DNA_START=33 /DNA_END=1050 /DNA_ORIENTATION=+